MKKRQILKKCLHWSVEQLQHYANSNYLKISEHRTINLILDYKILSFFYKQNKVNFEPKSFIRLIVAVLC